MKKSETRGGARERLHAAFQIRAGNEPGTPATQYPAYYKDVSSLTVIDIYGVHKLFGIDDPSGAIQHASKKLLLSGVRTGGKSKVDDVREARDTLTRWLELESDGC